MSALEQSPIHPETDAEGRMPEIDWEGNIAHTAFKHWARRWVFWNALQQEARKKSISPPHPEEPRLKRWRDETIHIGACAIDMVAGYKADKAEKQFIGLAEISLGAEFDYKDNQTLLTIDSHKADTQWWMEDAADMRSANHPLEIQD
jgi:hypothetical protein